MTSARNAARKAAPAKRRSARRAPKPSTERAPKVNDAVEIWWTVDKTFYRGRLTRRYPDNSFRVVYDDGEMEDLNLSTEFWRFAADDATAPRAPDPPDDPAPLPPPPPPPPPPPHAPARPPIVEEEVLDGSDLPSKTIKPPPHDTPKAAKKKEKKKDKPKDKPKDSPPASSAAKTAPLPTSKVANTPSQPPHALEEVLEEGGIGKHLQPKQSKPKQPMAKDTPSSAKSQAPSQAAKSKPKAKTPAKSRKDSGVADKPIAKAKPTRKSTTSEGMGSTLATRRAGAAQASRDAAAASSKVRSEKPSNTVAGAEPTQPPHGSKIGTARANSVTKLAPSKLPESKQEPARSNADASAVRRTSASTRGSTRASQQPSEPHGNTPKVGKPDTTRGTPGKLSTLPTGMSQKGCRPKTEKGKATKARHGEAQSQQPVGKAESSTPAAGPGDSRSGKPVTSSSTPQDKRGGNRDSADRASMAVPIHQGPAARGKDGTDSFPGPGTNPKASATEAPAPNKNREESIRSRSSSEKANTSFAAKRKKKKRGSAVNLPTPSLANASSAEGQRLAEGVVTDHMVVDAGVGAKAGPGLKTASTGTGMEPGAEMPGNGRENGDTLNAKAINHDKHGAPSNGAGLTPVSATAPTSGDPQHQSDEAGGFNVMMAKGRKRTRVENSEGAVGEGDGQLENASKRVKGGSHAREGPEQVNDALCTREDLASALLRQQQLTSSMISPLRVNLEGVVEDVRRLVSMVLGMKQDLSLYKDMTSSSFAEEGRASRSAEQDLRLELLHAIDERARKTEQRFEDGLKSLSSSIQAMLPPARVNQQSGAASRPVAGPVPGKPRAVAVPPQITNKLARVDKANVPKDNTVVQRRTNVHTTARANVVVASSNGRVESPTAIVSVGRPSAGANTNVRRENPPVLGAQQDTVPMATIESRVTHLVARQVTVWLLETPHEYNPGMGSIESWARQTAVRTFGKVAEQLMRFTSYEIAYQTLCSSLGNDAVELQWFVHPGVTEHLLRARKNYSAWDPPPSDLEWDGEVALLRELAERFRRAVRSHDLKNATDMQACVAIANLARSEEALAVPRSGGVGPIMPSALTNGSGVVRR